MDEKIIEMLGALGEDGIMAFYVYLAVDMLRTIIILAAAAWGIRAGWTPFCKMMFNV